MSARRSARSISHMRAVGYCLVILSVAMLVYGGMAMRYRAPAPTPYIPEATITPTPKEVWTQWLEADSSSLNNAYFIRNLDSGKKALCNGIYQGIVAFKEEITLPEPVHKDELGDLMWLIKYDCPELFQISGEYTYYVRQNEPDMVISVCPTYWMTQQEYILACEEVEAQLLSWKRQAEGLDLFKTQKLLYDSLMAVCTYQEEGPHTGTAYGALVLGRARCEGYAQALNMALRQAGMDCLILTGEAREEREQAGEGITEKAERHAWNAVKLGDDFYQLDATWDDSDGALSNGSAYAYFNVTDADMQSTRTLDPIFTRLKTPACNGTEYNYFVQAGLYIGEEQSVEQELFYMLDRMLADENSERMVLAKLASKEQFQSLTKNMKDWMDKWYGGHGFTTGFYNWTTYPDSRVFCISNLRYE